MKVWFYLRAYRLLLALALIPFTDVQAKDLYVDSAIGNDSTTWAANGSASPWRTLGRASWGSTNRNAPNLSQAAQAGDTVFVRAGTYLAPGTGSRMDPAFGPVNSGTSGAPIIFRAQGLVIIQPQIAQADVVQSASAGSIQLATSASSVNDAYAGWYIRIVSGTGAGQSRRISLPQAPGGQGVTAGSYTGATRTAQIQNVWSVIPNSTSRYELTMPGALVGAISKNYITWDGFRIVEGDSYSPDTGPVVFWATDHASFINNWVDGTALPLHCDNHNSIRIEGSTNILIRNNVLNIPRSNYVVGINNPQNEAAIMMYYTDNAVIENNDVTAFTGIFPKGGSGANGGHLIRYNRVHNCSKAFRVSYHTNVAIYQNLVENCDDMAFQPAESISNIRFYNNTIVDSASALNNWFPSTGFEFYNNIVANVTVPVYLEGGAGSGPFVSDHNDFSGYNQFIIGGTRGPLSVWQALGYDTVGSLEVNPLFVSTASRDFHLQAGSPVRTTSRSGQPMGMYITGSETIGFTLGTTPPPGCDVNIDGSINVSDVQLSVNQAIGSVSCGAGDINHDGRCDVVDVQRIVNSALGGACNTQ